jgi:hypothetical protein
VKSVVVLLGAVLLLFAAFLLIVHFLQGGSFVLVYVAMALALASIFLPEVARWLARRQDGNVGSSLPEPKLEVVTAASRVAPEPAGAARELPPLPGRRSDPPDFAAEPVFGAGPVVAASRAPNPVDHPAAAPDAETETADDVADRLARMETTVDALMERLDSRPPLRPSTRPHPHDRRPTRP